MINALFVETNGVYFNIEGIEPWDSTKNAFNCSNGLPAIAHPPCERWGRYWSGGPVIKSRLKLGDDRGCFAFALWYVRTYGGVLEHPEASHAWSFFGINKPPKKGGWIAADNYGGLTCCVEQGHYGHRSRKATWLYINQVKPVDLIWGKAEGKIAMDDGFHSRAERIEARRLGWKPSPRITKMERKATPIQFRDLLISIVSGTEEKKLK